MTDRTLNVTIGDDNTFLNSAIAIGNTIGRDLIQTINIIADIEIPSPPEPTRPPLSVHFIGRKEDLNRFAALLHDRHIAVITGPPGIGKTQLAANLAYQVCLPADIFWHSFHKNERLDTVLWKFAAFPAHHNEKELWSLIQRSVQTKGQLPPPEVLLDYIMQLLRGRNYLVCLDDFHHVENDPLSEQLAARVKAESDAGQLDVVITSRKMPARTNFPVSDPLGALNKENTRDFLIQRGLNLNDGQVMLLYTKTEGNIEFLALAADALNRSKHPDRILKNLSRAANIQATLMHQVDNSLTLEEKAVMGAVAILEGRRATGDLIETILDGQNVRRTLYTLSTSYLLLADEEADEPTFRQHAIVQEFYYDLLGTAERQLMHRRAAAYYEAEESWFVCAQQYRAAQDYHSAAKIASHDPWYFLNRGEGRATGALLESFTQSQLTPEEWISVQLSIGDIYAALHEYDRPMHAYQHALNTLDSLANPVIKLMYKARICYGLGTLLEYYDSDAALEWLEQGIELVDTLSRYEKALLYIRMGSVLIGVGAFERAKAVLEQGNALLPENAVLWQANVLTNLGVLYASQGNAKTGIAHYQQALAIYYTFQHQWNVIAVLQNIAIEHDIAGEWDTAMAEYQQVMAMADTVGSIIPQASAQLAMGILSTKRSNHDQAHTHLDNALTLSRDHDVQETLIASLSSKAYLLILDRSYDSAEQLLREAERLERERGGQDQLPEVYRNLALLNLANGQSEQACDLIEQSLNVAQELALSSEEGMTLRVKGTVLARQDKRDAAQVCFEDSLGILTETDPYEAALTQRLFGEFLIDTEIDSERGLSLRHEAINTLQRLGVR